MKTLPAAVVAATVLALSAHVGVLAVDNGIGLTPPMGWRHWKAFYANIDQSILERTMDELTTKRPVDGEPTSLAELGYLYVGLDDHWQNCTRTCANGTVVPSWWTNNGFDYASCVDPRTGKSNNTGSHVPPWHAPDGEPLAG